jgi:hypothetical protein
MLDGANISPALGANMLASRTRHFGIRKSKHLILGWRRFNGEPVRNPKIGR